MVLTSLAPELIHLICSFLDVQDVRMLRLACRMLEAVAAYHAFPELVIYLHHDDFDMLRRFADHPEYSKHVKSVVYVCDVLKPRCLTFKKYVAQKRKRDKIRWEVEQWKHRDFKLPGPMPQPPQPDSEEFMYGAYQRYKHVQEHQTRILAEGLDFTILKSVIPQFRNLKNITVSADRWFLEDQRHKTPFDDLFVTAGDYLEPPGCRHLGSLLMPLTGLPTTHLRSLKLGSIDWSFLEQLQEPSRLEQMIEVCQNLTTFELYLNTGADFDDAGWDGGGVHVFDCKGVVRQGGLRRLLGSMTRLENLAIGFTYPDEEMGLYPATLGDLVPEGMHWPNLWKFRFDLIEASRQDLVDFIRRHSSTVTEFHLQDLRLLASSWLVFLPQLRELAEDMFLDDLTISGTVYGETEGEGALAGSLTGEIEYYELDDGGGDCLAYEITDYIIWGDCENPLVAVEDSESETGGPWETGLEHFWDDWE